MVGLYNCIILKDRSQSPNILSRALLNEQEYEDKGCTDAQAGAEMNLKRGKVGRSIDQM